MGLNSDKTPTNKVDEGKKWLNKKNIIILSVIVIFILILGIIALSGTDLGSIFQGWTDYYYATFGALGIYLIIFLISTFANMTILFPIPYAIALAYIAINIYDGSIVGVNIWLLGIIAGIGATIGEISAYYLGKGSASLLESKEEGKSIKKMKDRINRGWAIPLMFLCAATFIPDDPLLILLGYAGYSLWKMLVTYFVGKIVLCVSTLYFVILAQDIPGISEFLWILGLSEKPVEPWISFLGWVVVMLLFILIFFVDWKSVFKKVYRKLFKRKEKTSETNLLCFLSKTHIFTKQFNKFGKFKYN